MRPPWRSRRAHREGSPAALLRRARPGPSEELVRRIALQVERSARPSTARRRLATAAAVTIVALVAAGTLGGIGYAASSVNRAASAVRTVVAPAKPLVPVRTLRLTQPSSSTAPSRTAAPVTTKESDSSGAKKGGKDDDDDDDDDDDPDDDEYKPGKGCGDKKHVHFKEGQCKDKKDKKDNK